MFIVSIYRLFGFSQFSVIIRVRAMVCDITASNMIFGTYPLEKPPKNEGV